MKSKKYDIILYFICIFVVLISTVIGNSYRLIADLKIDDTSSVVEITRSPEKTTVILDAGHGGEDSGAVGLDGILEKELNLSLCRQIQDILTAFNIDVIMTRTEDKLLYTDEQNIKGQRKMYDLKNRYLIAAERENVVFVSIHMNKFPEERYKGLQVYYSPNNLKSKELALSIQSSICNRLQKDNTRKIKEATSAIYLLDRLSCPAVLVECGFLSNAEDCDRLTNEKYRKQMAFIISSAIIENLY